MNGVRQEIVLALIICDYVYSKHGQELVATSINDSKHSETSLHYSGCAVDLRTHYFKKDEVKMVASDIRERLTIDYDVIVEKDHIHLEYQPRRR